MRVLVDTHAALWIAHEAPELSVRARAVASDEASETILSVASVWELGIKMGLGKLKLRGTCRDFVDRATSKGRMSLLDITVEHIDVASALPPHHRDPFDRLLVAQAIVERVPLVSADAALDAYGVERIW